MRSGLRRKALCLLFGLGGLVFGIAGAESTFGRLREAQGAALLFSVELRDEAGALLASPMLVGCRSTCRRARAAAASCASSTASLSKAGGPAADG